MSETRKPLRLIVPSVDAVTTTSNSAPLTAAHRPYRMGGVTVALLTLTAALATSTSYVIQPELTEVARDLGSSVSTISVAAGSAIVGYLVGLVLLVPLVDHLRSNLLGVGLFVSGVCASTGAQMSTLAGKHASPKHRGRALGTVTAGISAGILLGRILGGAMAEQLGWRHMLLVVAAACVAVGLTALGALPPAEIHASESYRTVLRSMPALLRSERRLRIAATSGALWFFAFSLVWVSVSLALSLPPLNLSPAAVGLYSLAGLAGILATRIAGALADRHGSPRVVLVGLALAFACAITMSFSLQLTPVLLVSLALFDAGLFAAQVANQSRVLSLDPSRPAKFNSTYMAVYFIGGTAGTAVGGSLVSWIGWPGAASIAAAAITIAALITRLAQSKHRPGA